MLDGTADRSLNQRLMPSRVAWGKVFSKILWVHKKVGINNSLGNKSHAK